ncbi:hypothetical protein [Streptomyces cylindrosporus]|uniref:Uncharacterized protein n=1 Tax=Streptomyces cylindrosporus TaxID=2927583 RepID=A0ABS9YJJ3_9ACTN|nr:hypothetical protein [Streptomyces cylindrosporus]MCI3277369.1 hypothetical protein [Streptomyces cylindrosporus]
MSLDDLITPVGADDMAKFTGKGGKAAGINYDVPLPGAYDWRRIVPLAFPGAVFTDFARRSGTSLLQLGVVKGDDGRLTGIDRDKLVQLYRRTMPVTAKPSLRLVAEVGGDVNPLLGGAVAARGLDTPQGTESVRDKLIARRQLNAEPEDVPLQRTRIDSYLEKLADREAAVTVPANQATATITVPAPGLGDSVVPVTVDPVASVAPRLALVETWELRSFLGDYGLGRTLQTFSLLPGERQTITVETWRSAAATREDATSVFESADSAAQTRFTSSLLNESGAAQQDQGGWALSVSSSSKGGAHFLGLVDLETRLDTSFAANHQEASQRWASSVSQTARDHAAQVNNSRRQSAESTSQVSTASGATSTIVREISNTNLRRVLNFVFRELNQTYETHIVLRDIKVAFFNGRLGSAEIVALPDLGRLLERHVVEGERAEVAAKILSLCAERIDADGDLVTTLQVGRNPRGVKYDWKTAPLGDDGRVVPQHADPFEGGARWRFRPVKVVDGREQELDGVVMDRTDVVLRTDNLVVEALLGQADALDPYAAALQALDLVNRQSETAARDGETRRTTDALGLVLAQKEDQRIDAWQKLFPDEPDIEVVPVAAVSHNGDESHG